MNETIMSNLEITFEKLDHMTGFQFAVESFNGKHLAPHMVIESWINDCMRLGPEKETFHTSVGFDDGSKRVISARTSDREIAARKLYGYVKAVEQIRSALHSQGFSFNLNLNKDTQ